MSAIAKALAPDVVAAGKPQWRRSPTRAPEATKLSPDELCDKMDAYFENRYDAGDDPNFCDLAGATGFDSVNQMLNHARRRGGEVMRAISRAMLAVGASYEEQLQNGSRTASFMLERLPQFDSQEPASQAPEQPFRLQKEINLQITGVEQSQTRGAQLSAQEAYLQIIKHHTYEEMLPHIVETEQTEDGDYKVLELEIDSTEEVQS